MRRLWIAAIGCVVLAGSIWAGAAQARIDRGYGDEGVAAVQAPLPASWQDQGVLHLVAARDGSAYALIKGRHCEATPFRYYCPFSYALVRYGRDGFLDRAFGGAAGYYELPFERQPVLAVDSAGLPVVAKNVGGEISILRVTAGGSPDARFGSEGVAGFRCNCGRGETHLIAGPHESLTVAVPRTVGSGRRNEQSGTVVGLARLRGDGSFDKRFGAAGSATVGLPNTAPFVAAATGKGGALYLAGAGCCKAHRGYLVRISAKGHYDRRFARESGRSLRAAKRFGSLARSVNAVLLRSHGRIDVLGSAGYDRGFMLRLDRHGRRIRKFARKGLRGTPLPIDAAAHGSHGATIALSNTNLRGIGILVRIQHDGHMDRRFGREPIPGSEGLPGIEIVSLVRHRVLALSVGPRECREACPPQAQMVRYTE